MVASASPALDPPAQRKGVSPAQAALRIGMPARAIQRQLAAAPQDGFGRVTEGPWAGAYHRRTHWRLPAATVQRVAAVVRTERTALQQETVQREKAAMAALRRALTETDAKIERVSRAIVAAMDAFTRELNGGTS